MCLTEQEQTQLAGLRSQLKTLQSEIAKLEEKDTHWKAVQKRERERKKMAVAGTSAHRVAQLLAKFQKGKKPITDDKQLQWAVDLIETVETYGELKTASLVRFVFASQNQYWKSRITTAKLLIANLATIISQHEVWVQHGAPASVMDELSIVDVPSIEVFAAVKKLKAPHTPTHEDNVRVQWLCQKHTDAEVCAIVDFMHADPFWFDKMSINMLVAKYDLLKTQMEKKLTQHPKVADATSRWGGTAVNTPTRGEV